MAKFQENAKHLRKQEIIKALQESSLTIRDLEEKLGASYHTIRFDILELEKEGTVKQIGGRSGAAVWSAATSALTGWPLIANVESGYKGNSLRNRATSLRNKAYIGEATKAAFVADQMFMRTILYANDLRTGHGYQKDDINARHNELKKCIRILETFVIELKSLDIQERMWSKIGLEQISAIDDMPEKKMCKQVEEEEIIIIDVMFNKFVEDIAEEIRAITQANKDKEDKSNTTKGADDAAKRDDDEGSGIPTDEAANVAGATEVRSSNHDDVPGEGTGHVECDVPSMVQGEERRQLTAPDNIDINLL